ncbi:MAG: DUF2007 domain-containing protein [Candidatus Xenobiia bacterium LiM19]
MFCPKCKAEYEPHVRNCKDCQLELVESLPPEPPEPEPSYQELVTVYSAPSPAMLDMAQSILQSAEIKYYIKGELIQNIIAFGTYGGSFNLSVGPPEIQVAPDDAEEARILLNELAENEPEASDDGGAESSESEEGLTEEEEESADEMADELAEEEREEAEYEDEGEEYEDEEESEEEEGAAVEVKESAVEEKAADAENTEAAVEEKAADAESSEKTPTDEDAPQKEKAD